MNKIIIPLFLIIYGSYLSIIGLLNILMKKQILGILELIHLRSVKIKKGLDAYENRKSDLLETSKHKLFSINYLIVGIPCLVIGIFLLQQ